MKHGFYTRLAFTNIRKNKRTYVPYILTCILTVMMYYLVTSLSRNPGIQEMYGGTSIASLMRIGTSVIAIFAFLFLFYTNSFLIRHRQKEFGVFNILGMEKKHLAKVILLETILVTVVSLGLGIGAGILFDKLMFLLIGRLVGAEISLGFFVSGRVILSTGKLFSGIFLVIYLKAVYTIRVSNPIELLRGGNTGEKEPKAKWLLGLAGAVCLGSGYGMAVLIKNPITSMQLFFAAVVLVIIGTYLLFTAGSIIILKLLRRNKRFYYQPKHFISVSGMIYRMKQNAAGLANICILSTMVLVMLSSTTSLMFGMEDMLKLRYSNDFVIQADRTDAKQHEKLYRQAESICEEEGIAVENKREYSYLLLMAEQKGDWFETDVEKIDTHGDVSGFRSLFFIPLSDYNASSEKEYVLTENEALLFSDYEPYGERELGVFDREYEIAGHLEQLFGNKMLQTNANIITSYYLVVTDEEFERLADSAEAVSSKVHTYYGFDTPVSRKKQEALEERLVSVMNSGEYGGPFDGKLETRVGNRKDFMGIYGGLFFLGLFLGALFIMAAVLIIYYKQISEGYEDRERFEIMQKVGMTHAEVKQTIRSQVLMVFFLPLIAAGIHTAFAFSMLKLLLELIGMVNVKLYLLCTVGAFLVFAVLYVFIYSLTARTYYKIVKR